MRKHRFVFIRYEDLSRKVPLYKCKHCRREYHLELW